MSIIINGKVIAGLPDNIPETEGNSGKYLSTDGDSIFWAAAASETFSNFQNFSSHTLTLSASEDAIIVFQNKAIVMLNGCYFKGEPGPVLRMAGMPEGTSLPYFASYPVNKNDVLYITTNNTSGPTTIYYSILPLTDVSGDESESSEDESSI